MEQELTRKILRTVRQVEVRTRRLVDDSLAGSYHSVFKGRGMNVDEVREYVPGDEVRAIDWNVTARTGVPHVKKFTEERELTILLLIDVSRSGLFGSGGESKREMMAEVGSVLAFSAVRNNDRVGLLLFTEKPELYIPPKKGRSHILRVIREILFFKPRGRGTDIGQALDLVNRMNRRRVVLFLLSDFCLPGDHEQSLADLATPLYLTGRRHDLIAISITDPREHELPDVGWITLEDAESGEQVQLNTSDAWTRKAYANLAADQHRQLRATMRKNGIDLLELKTDAPYTAPLVRFFKSRGRRRGQ
jgi:uncharacterized protein (DUF58 family)